MTRKLLDRVGDKIILKHFSIKTEKVESRKRIVVKMSYKKVQEPVVCGGFFK